MIHGLCCCRCLLPTCPDPTRNNTLSEISKQIEMQNPKKSTGYPVIAVFFFDHHATASNLNVHLLLISQPTPSIRVIVHRWTATTALIKTGDARAEAAEGAAEPVPEAGGLLAPSPPPPLNDNDDACRRWRMGRRRRGLDDDAAAPRVRVHVVGRRWRPEAEETMLVSARLVTNYCIARVDGLCRKSVGLQATSPGASMHQGTETE